MKLLPQLVIPTLPLPLPMSQPAGPSMTAAQAPASRPATPTTDTSNTKVGALQGKAPAVFTGNRKESKRFISKLRVYFLLNQKHLDITNTYSKTLITLSFIQEDNIVNWVNAQVQTLDRELQRQCQGDEEDE